MSWSQFIKVETLDRQRGLHQQLVTWLKQLPDMLSLVLQERLDAKCSSEVNHGKFLLDPDLYSHSPLTNPARVCVHQVT